jgi:LPXTG-motif cell wall-anchored protein
MSDGMPMVTTGGAVALAATGVQAGTVWVVVAAAALVVVGAVLLRLRRRASGAPGAR